MISITLSKGKQGQELTGNSPTEPHASPSLPVGNIRNEICLQNAFQKYLKWVSQTGEFFYSPVAREVGQEPANEKLPYSIKIRSLC